MLYVDIVIIETFEEKKGNISWKNTFVHDKYWQKYIIVIFKTKVCETGPVRESNPGPLAP